MSTALYRHFANDGSLLYVGISLSWPTRTRAHARGSQWFEQVARVEIERFPDREAALEAERDAIKRERPRFNVMHNRAVAAPPKVPIRQEARWLRGREGDQLLAGIGGPDAIVGPALVYRGNDISVMIAHGQFGTAGEVTEVILGQFFPGTPEWAHSCASVISIRGAGEITMEEAGDARRDVIQKLRIHLRTVEAFDTDIALAVANACRFPSEKARKILDDVAVERGAAT